MKNGGRLLAECLVAQGVERLFCVPGESYLRFWMRLPTPT